VTWFLLSGFPSPQLPAVQPFVKVQKNKAYHKRFQTKWRRRRGAWRTLH